MAKASQADLAWVQFDRVIADAITNGHSSPWDGDEYVPDLVVLETLLGIARGVVGKETTAGVLAKALDAWLAYELRRAGFDPEAVWPRASTPRIVPRAITSLFEAFEAKNGASAAEIAPVRARLYGTSAPSGLVSANASVLGKMYTKQVDVLLTDALTGPELLISTKRMDGSIGNNAANRIEESYGDAKNLRGRHPLTALGFVFGLGAPAVREKPGPAIKLLDLLGKLSNEQDAYDAVALILLDYDPDEPSLDVPEALDLAARTSDVGADAVAAQIARAPKVTVHTSLRLPNGALFAVPEALHSSVALKTLIEHVLRVTPVAFHTEARIRHHLMYELSEDVGQTGDDEDLGIAP